MEYIIISILATAIIIPTYAIIMARYLNKKNAYKMMKVGQWQKCAVFKGEVVSKTEYQELLNKTEE